MKLSQSYQWLMRLPVYMTKQKVSDQITDFIEMRLILGKIVKSLVQNKAKNSRAQVEKVKKFNFSRFEAAFESLELACLC